MKKGGEDGQDENGRWRGGELLGTRFGSRLGSEQNAGGSSQKGKEERKGRGTTTEEEGGSGLGTLAQP